MLFYSRARILRVVLFVFNQNKRKKAVFSWSYAKMRLVVPPVSFCVVSNS